MLNAHVMQFSGTSRVLAPRSLVLKPKIVVQKQRRQLPIANIATAYKTGAYTWENIKRETASELKDFVLRKGQSPSTAPGPTLPTEEGSHLRSTKPVVLFRDTNAWCPYCERVWLALEYKQIPYDTVLINLTDKPDWYVNMVPTKLVPAVSFSGEVLSESQDILLALEERFPSPPLLPEDAEAKQAALTWLAELTGAQMEAAGFRYLAGGAFMSSEPKDPAKLPEYKAEYEQKLQWFEEQLAKHEGPFLLGEQFSILDICILSGMERVLNGVPIFRGFNPLTSPAYPNLQAWNAGIEALPAFQKVKTDPETFRLLFTKRFGVGSPGHGLDLLAGVSEEEFKARKEVAAKLYANRSAIVTDIVSKSGLSRPRGSRYGQTMYSYNGYEAAPSPGIPDAVEGAMLWLAHYLTTGDETRPKVSAEAAAVSAVALAYFRNRASAPRDMSAPAAVQLRAACDHLLTRVC